MGAHRFGEPRPEDPWVVAAMRGGGTHIDHVEMLARPDGTGRVLGFIPVAPSTVGSFLRKRPPARSVLSAHARVVPGGWARGARRRRPGLHDLRGRQRVEARRRLPNGLSPAAGTHAPSPGEVLVARMRKGSADVVARRGPRSSSTSPDREQASSTRQGESAGRPDPDGARRLEGFAQCASHPRSGRALQHYRARSTPPPTNTDHQMVDAEVTVRH